MQQIFFSATWLKKNYNKSSSKQASTSRSQTLVLSIRNNKVHYHLLDTRAHQEPKACSAHRATTVCKNMWNHVDREILSFVAVKGDGGVVSFSHTVEWKSFSQYVSCSKELFLICLGWMFNAFKFTVKSTQFRYV